MAPRIGPDNVFYAGPPAAAISSPPIKRTLEILGTSFSFGREAYNASR